ncbi:FKBP-type peptidyl-prolyl cis-trans isomerase [bacterium]|nr:FKBP-type peptidyl-prolyl cis-trans isomerase [bacterium]
MKHFFWLLIIPTFLWAQDVPSDTVTTASGLRYLIYKKGDGVAAAKGQFVEVHYTGFLMDGKVFDSSRDRGETFDFTLGSGQVIKGWDEGVALMHAGDQFRFIIPAKLAYGERGVPNVIPPNATLLFDVELLSVSAPKVSIAQMLAPLIVQKGVFEAIKVYRELKQAKPNDYNFKESQLNTLGYQLLQSGRVFDAIEILKLNAEVFPSSSNVYDSLAEACVAMGDKTNAIKHYKKSVELNPNNTNAIEMLKILQPSK